MKRRYRLDQPPLAGHAGRGVRVAVIDSGVHAAHPHISSIAKTFDLVGDDGADRLGHGTAVAAAILEKAPAIELVVIRVFDQSLSTTSGVLQEALDLAAQEQCALINLSLGSTNSALRLPQSGTVVSAKEWYPGCLEGAVGVQLDWNCPRDELWIEDGVYYASPLPRPIPGIPHERNFSGISFAVANVTGFLARALEVRAI